MARKFLLIASYPGSILNFRAQLIQSLLDSDFEVHVASPDMFQDENLRSTLNLLGVHCHEIFLKRNGMNPIYDLQTIFQIWFLMFRIKPDFFLGYTIKPVIYGSIAAWLARVPSRNALITGLGYFFIDISSQRPFLFRFVCGLYHVALLCTGKVFFQNPDDEALFRSLKIIDRSASKTCVLNGSGIDTERFAQAEFPQHIKFLMIARLLRSKGVMEYASAAKSLGISHPEIKFGLVGWIDDNPDSITLAELREIQKLSNFEFYGRLDDVRQAIAGSSVYVLPSYREGTPRTVLEAMAMGRPVITTDVPGCRETVIEGKNGFLVKVKSVDELAAAMIQFIESPHLISRMGRQSRQIAMDKYDVHKVNSVMLKEMAITC